MRVQSVVRVLSSIALFSMAVARADLVPESQVVVITASAPPFSMAPDLKKFAKADEVKGIEADTVQQMFQRAGVPYNLTLRFPWERIYKLALDTPDYGVFPVVKDSSRAPLFKWVGPLITNQRVFVTTANSTVQVGSLKDIKKYRVGSFDGSATAAYLASNNVTFSSAPNDPENAERLIDGRIDLWATTGPAFQYFAAKQNIHGLKVVYTAEVDSQHYLALNPNTPDDVVARLQKALEQMQADGTAAKLAAPYLDAQ